MKDDYYAMEVHSMDTDAGFRQAGRYDRDVVATHDGGNDDELWAFDGYWFGNRLDNDDLAAICAYDGPNESGCIRARVEDNGKHGDGLWLSFAPITRHGKPATHGDRWWHGDSDREPAGLFGIRLTPAQARVLGGALIAAATLADAQEGLLDPKEEP